MGQTIADFIDKYGIGLYIPRVHITDIIEVLILTFLIYQIIIWIKNTKAWMLLRGIIVLAGFILLAAIFKMHTILFIARNSLTVMATAGNCSISAGTAEGTGKAWREAIPDISCSF